MNAQAAHPLRVTRPPSDRPWMLFDGDCNFCRGWIARWKKGTADRVEYAEFQSAADRFPEIPREAFEGAVQLIETDGSVSSGADAVFRLCDFAARPLLLCRVRRIPGFMPVARVFYGIVARHRMFFSRLTRLVGWSSKQ